MRRPAFGATTLLISMLALIGLGVRAWKPFILPPGSNGLQNASGMFLRKAAHQPIKWLQIEEGPDPFYEARHDNTKPIMLVIGTPWSRMGRLADEGIFSDPDIQAYLGHWFICVRIDASRRPEWLNAYLPFSRAGSLSSPRFAQNFIPDFQIWFLDQSGRPYDAILIDSPRQVLDYYSFRGKLADVRQALNEIDVEEAPSRMPAGGDQLRDLEMLRNPPVVQWSSSDVGDSLREASAPSLGGSPNSPLLGPASYQRLLPNALRYQLMTGRMEDFEAAIHDALRGDVVDWLDGGFFIRSASLDWMQPEYDKTAVQNAELMQVLALAGALYRTPEYQNPAKADEYDHLARATFDCLTGPFMKDGLVQACQIGDEERDDRSEHASFPPPVLRSVLGGLTIRLASGARAGAYPWAQENLGLNYWDNPRMLVRVDDLRLPEREPQAFSAVMQALRASAADRPADFDESALAEVNGIVAARMLWVARLWGDRSRLDKATALFDRLQRMFVSGEEVVHSKDETDPSYRYLGDYLAYADAALQDYLATGRASSFDSGMAVLRRAKAVFAADPPGNWTVVPRDPDLPGRTVRDRPWRDLICCPEIVDNESESCTARVIRLSNDYGRMLEPPASEPRSAGAPARLLLGDAESVADLFNLIAAGVGPAAAGYRCAQLGAWDDMRAFVVGPQCVAAAARLARLAPLRMTSCCFGTVRPDLQARKPGVYLVTSTRSGQVVQGPLSVSEAVAKLRRPLQ